MPFKDPPKPPDVHTIELNENQYTPIPGSTKKVLMGPGALKVTRWPDGGVDGQVVEGRIVELFDAVHTKLERVPW